MPVNQKRTIAGAIILAAAAYGFLAANVLQSPVSASKVGGDATVSPFAMMTQAPLNLPVEQYEAH
jgi:hypothetical protein